MKKSSELPIPFWSALLLLKAASGQGDPHHYFLNLLTVPTTGCKREPCEGHRHLYDPRLGRRHCQLGAKCNLEAAGSNMEVLKWPRRHSDQSFLRHRSLILASSRFIGDRLRAGQYCLDICCTHSGQPQEIQWFNADSTTRHPGSTKDASDPVSTVYSSHVHSSKTKSPSTRSDGSTASSTSSHQKYSTTLSRPTRTRGDKNSHTTALTTLGRSYPIPKGILPCAESFSYTLMIEGSYPMRFRFGFWAPKQQRHGNTKSDSLIGLQE